MRIRKLLAVLAILLLPALAFAQAETTGRVVGKVVDEEGNPVVGARVSFVSPALLGERVVTTGAGGQFVAALLPVGAYSVTAAAPGMQPQQISFRLGVGQTVPLDITLKRGEAVVEQVTVYGTATKMETTALGENFSSKAVDELPITVRTLENIASYAPNIAFGPTPGHSRSPALRRSTTTCCSTGPRYRTRTSAAPLVSTSRTPSKRSRCLRPACRHGTAGSRAAS
jgi:hypothetical protein